MKSSFSLCRSIFLFALIVTLVTGFFFYLHRNVDKFRELFNISSCSLISLAVFALIGMFINGFVTTFLFQGLGVRLSHRDGFILAATSTLANQLPISGGMIARGYYLKKKYDLSYSRFFSVSVALFVCFLTVNGLVGVMVLFYNLVIRELPASPFLWLGFLLMFGSVGLFWLPLYEVKIPERFYKWLSQSIEGWMFMSKNPIVAAKLIGLQTVMMLFVAGRYYFSFRMLSQNVNASDVILFASASVLTQLVSIAPGGLGVTEAIVASVASLLGFDMGISVVAVGLDRLVSTMVIFVVGGISTVVLGKQLSDVPQELDGTE